MGIDSQGKNSGQFGELKMIESMAISALGRNLYTLLFMSRKKGVKLGDTF
jgi:hypothetical protein